MKEGEDSLGGIAGLKTGKEGVRGWVFLGFTFVGFHKLHNMKMDTKLENSNLVSIFLERDVDVDKMVCEEGRDD
jgi:hypothetical protein